MSFVNVTTLPQQVSLALAPAISGALSLLGSLTIVWMIGRGRRYADNLKYRLLLGICLSDVISSSMFLVWSLWMPRGTPGIWGAMGNQTTCNIQGFIINLTVSGNFYNGALAGYYWLSVCHYLSDHEIARRFERPTHIVSIAWPLAIAIAAWVQDFFGPSAIGCWMTPTPLLCERDDTCEKGHYAYKFAWIYTGGPLLIVGAFIGYCMVQIYRGVRENTRALERYDFESQHRHSQLSVGSAESAPTRAWLGESWNVSPRAPLGASIDPVRRSNSATMLRETSLQAFLYVGAYLFTHLFAYVCPNIEVAGGVNPFWTLLLQNMLYPLQGFFNVFIFLRPRILSLRKRDGTMSLMKTIYNATFRYEEYQPRRSNGHALRKNSYPTTRVNSVKRAAADLMARSSQRKADDSNVVDRIEVEQEQERRVSSVSFAKEDDSGSMSFEVAELESTIEEETAEPQQDSFSNSPEE